MISRPCPDRKRGHLATAVVKEHAWRSLSFWAKQPCEADLNPAACLQDTNPPYGYIPESRTGAVFLLLSHDSSPDRGRMVDWASPTPAGVDR